MQISLVSSRFLSEKLTKTAIMAEPIAPESFMRLISTNDDLLTSNTVSLSYVILCDSNGEGNRQYI